MARFLAEVVDLLGVYNSDIEQSGTPSCQSKDDPQACALLLFDWSDFISGDEGAMSWRYGISLAVVKGHRRLSLVLSFFR